MKYAHSSNISLVLAYRGNDALGVSTIGQAMPFLGLALR
jgi:hypothetical protein